MRKDSYDKTGYIVANFEDSLFLVKGEHFILIHLLSDEILFMRSSCHNRSVEISVEPRNFRRTLDFYLLLFFQLIILLQSDHQRVYIFE